MMKRTGVPRLGPEEPMPPQSPVQDKTEIDKETTPPSPQLVVANGLADQVTIQQPSASNMHTLAQSAQPPILGATMLSVGGSGFGRPSSRPGANNPGIPGNPVINYMQKTTAVQYTKQPPPQTPPRLKALSPQQPPLSSLPPALGRQSPVPAPLPPAGVVGSPNPPPGTQFQRLKVEDALSYLDQVKYKFNTQPQVYNDFLDIMKEFKSQTIDTPGVITRVSSLFKGHPELIVGFNTFLPPGYKIEVQSNGLVSVSMPSPTTFSAGNVLLGVQHAPAQPQFHLLPVPQSVSNAIVQNLSVSVAPTNTLHQISQAHQQIEAAAIHHNAGSTPPTTAAHAAPAPASQPVEFNHAIEYVNKIKSRFSRQPDKYKRFLEILHAYQRGHREMKEPQAKQQTEQEVYSQVAKLFENQDDLLAEFGQFLPDAKAVTKPLSERHFPLVRSPPLLPQHQRAESEPERFPPAPPASPPPAHPPLQLTHHHTQVPKHTTTSTSTATAPPLPQQPPPPQQQQQQQQSHHHHHHHHHHLKRSPSFSSSSQLAVGAPPAKKSRVSGLTGATVRDVSYAEAAKLATVHDFNFFDRARKALRSQVYDNFLRCLQLFTNEIISSSELLCVTAPFLCRHPELQKWLQDFLGPPSPPHTPTSTTNSGYNNSYSSTNNSVLSYERDRLDIKPTVRYEPIGPLGAQLRHERPQGDAAMDIDLSTCKRLGTSYCALPRDAAARRCSGRTALCKEVLNDTWVSFPTWSEDSTFVTSRKTQYEEYIYRCEDERFELDVVIETNASTIRVLEGVQKKLSRMTPEDAAKYRLDDCLGGHSPTIHQRALRRIYGDKAVDIIAGLKKNPAVAVPVVLRRLKAKEEEWREAQKGFNKQWREQNEKYYLKSLDHQGINFKQNDLKAMRSKSLFNEVESAFAARRPGPHLIVDLNMQNRQEAIKILRDTAELLIHHARRQTAIQKAEKRRIKQLLRQFLPDLFAHPRQPLSDDERDEEEKEGSSSPGSTTAEHTAPDDKNNSSAVKQEKQETSESDNASDGGSKNNKNKENKPKNNNNTDSKENATAPANNVKRSSSNEEMNVKAEIKMEPQDMEEDYRDYPPNEGRFVCTSAWYIFMRVHAALCQRLAAARRTALALQREHDAQRPAHPAVAAALRLKPNNLPPDVTSPAEYYSVLIELVKGVLDGNTEPAAYEDAAREMLGIKAYPAYTLDKLVSIAVRQLQSIVSEPWSIRATELARGGMRGSLAYVRRAVRYLRHGHSSYLIKVYGGDDCKVTFEMLERATEGRTSPQHHDSRFSPPNQGGNHGSAAARLAAWSLYAERLARGAGVGPGAGGGAAPRNKPVFLVRNARARSGGYTHNAHSLPAPSAPVTHGHARRKPAPHDAGHTHAPAWRRHAALYRRGALAAARASHSRLHAKRRERFRAWLRARP